MDANEAFDRLVQSLLALSLDYAEQIALFPDYVAVPDELAEIYGDSFEYSEIARKSGLIDELCFSKMQDLDDELDRISGEENAVYWTDNALKNNPKWEEIRSSSESILIMLGKNKGKPDLGWLTYVKHDED